MRAVGHTGPAARGAYGGPDAAGPAVAEFARAAAKGESGTVPGQNACLTGIFPGVNGLTGMTVLAGWVRRTRARLARKAPFTIWFMVFAGFLGASRTIIRIKH